MKDQEIEITEDQMDCMAKFLLGRGIDPSNPEFLEHIRDCDCLTCSAAKAFVVLFGDRLVTLAEMENANSATRQ